MKRALIASGVVVLFALAALAQRGRYTADDDPAIAAREAEFHFLRVEYTDLPQYHRGFGYASRDGQGNGWWLVDWPDADKQKFVDEHSHGWQERGDALRDLFADA